MQKELKVAHTHSFAGQGLPATGTLRAACTHPFAEQGLFAAEASMQQELTEKLVLTLSLNKASTQKELTE